MKRAWSLVLGLLVFLPSPAGGAGAKAEPTWECVDLNHVLPFGESSVRSLAVLPDGTVLGGCGGAAAHLFALDPKCLFQNPVRRPSEPVASDGSGTGSKTGAVRDLKRWAQAGPGGSPAPCFVRNLTLAADGRFWMVVGSLPGEILPDDAKIESDRLLSGSLVDGRLELKDHGTPVPGEGILCIALDRSSSRLYGMARPTPILFQYDMARSEFVELARLGERESFETALTWLAPPERVSKLSPVLAVAADGDVYGVTAGVLFRWSAAPAGPKSKKPPQITRLARLRVPSASERSRTEGTVVEALVWAGDGRLFGGTYDGYLFAADLAAGEIVNLGKPFRQGRIRALAAAEDGRIFGLCGEETGRCRAFSYGAKEGYREMEGPRTPPRAWFRSDTLDALAVTNEGTLCIGGSGRMTAVYLCQPPAAK